MLRTYELGAVRIFARLKYKFLLTLTNQAGLDLDYFALVMLRITNHY